mgnify:CR=1 FL=1
MVLKFEIDNVKYEYRKDFIGEDGVYWLDVENKTYAIVDSISVNVQAEVDRLLAIEASLEYSGLRKAKYDLLNQDEMRYDDVKNSTTTWVDAIDAIKAAHPKP